MTTRAREEGLAVAPQEGAGGMEGDSHQLLQFSVPY